MRHAGFTIETFDADDASAVEQAAAILHAEIGPPRHAGFGSLAGARDEVRDCLADGRHAFLARAANGDILGWAGARPEYDGHVWELHPLVVRRDAQRRGIGTALVAAVESLARDKGGLTLLLGADDEDFRSSLGGVDLYDALPARLAAASTDRDHPIAFYTRIGFTIVGVIPDANGRRKPDILLAKRLRP